MAGGEEVVSDPRTAREVAVDAEVSAEAAVLHGLDLRDQSVVLAVDPRLVLPRVLVDLVAPDVPVRVDVDPEAGRQILVTGPLRAGPVSVVAEGAVAVEVLRDANPLEQVAVLALDVGLFLGLALGQLRRR